MKKFNLMILATLGGLFALCSCVGSDTGNKVAANVDTSVVDLPVEKRLELAKKYEYIAPFSDGLAEVRLNGKSGFIDKTGKPVIPCEYDGVDDDGFIDGITFVKLNGKNRIVDKANKQIVPSEYDVDVVEVCEDGIMPIVPLNEKWGVIDKTGKSILPCVYDGVEYFGVGILVAVIEDSDGKKTKYYYDKNGDFLGN